MTGDYTKVPLRDTDRWTGARMQQGRVLLDHEWNLNLDAAARTMADTARDVIGGSGVPESSAAFQVAFAGATPPRGMTVEGGRIWADGRCAYAPDRFQYDAQEAIAPPPAGGRAFVYLEVYAEELQPAEAWDEIVDPALDPVDAAARQQVGWRVRAVSSSVGSAEQAIAALGFKARSTGPLSIRRTAPAATPDPCDPPGDPLGLLPDGLLRVEVMSDGDAGTARFAWTADGGATTGRVAALGGAQVTLAPAPVVKFAPGDLVEVSWRTRRADRIPHGPLYTVQGVTADAAGDVLTLSRAPSPPAGAAGLVVRRWDGEVAGASNEVTARIRGADLGLRFTAAAGSYLTGDWWGAWLRPASEAGVEVRAAVPTDAAARAIVPLAFVDLTAQNVLQDCRPRFPQLARIPRTTATAVAFPGDDLQAAADRLPATGGELALAAGQYVLSRPVTITGKKRISVTGAGPATVLTGAGTESVLFFDNCTEVEVRRLRAEGGSGGPRLDGALTFTACSRVQVRDCDLACADAVTDRSQTCVTVRGGPAGLPRQIVVRDNRLEVGVRQIGILVLDADDTLISGNDIRHVPSAKPPALPLHLVNSELARIAGDVDFGRYGPRLTALRATMNQQAEPLINNGVPRRRALRAVARNLTRDLGPQRAHELVGATSSGQLLNALSGIVVAGQRARGVRITDNLVEGAAQAIHVATSHARVAGREVAGDVLIAGNILRVLIPIVYNRDRHAVFVGSTLRLTIADTTAELFRLGKEEKTPATAVRVYGQLGTLLMIRNTTIAGFDAGIRVTALAPVPAVARRLWIVTDTLALGTAEAVTAPFPFDATRNVGVPP